MAMLPVDLDDLENDIRETFEEIGDSYAMDVFLYQTPTSGGVYRENKFKTYKKEISLTGRIKINPKAEELSEVGIRKECTCIFTFDTKQLKSRGVIKIDEDTKAENCIIVTGSVIRYKGRYYEIKNICPVAMIGDRFLLYKFEGKELENTDNLVFNEGDTEDGGSNG